MAGVPDLKPAARKVASRAEWDVLRAQKLGPCRVCRDTYQIELHHLVPRSLGGGDVEANLVPLCNLCHMRYERRSDKLAAHLLRHALTYEEHAYVIAAKGLDWLNRYYPVLSGDAPPSSQGGIAGEDKPEGAIGTTLSAHDTGRDPESSPNSPRYTDPQSESVYREPSALSEGDAPGTPVPRARSANAAGDSGYHPVRPAPPSESADEPCTACKGTGRRQRRNTTTKRGQRFSIAIPVAEPDGKDALANDIRWCGDALNLELGYTAETPPYYILRAVLQDWRDRFSTRGAKNSA